MTQEAIVAAEAVVPCHDLDETIAFFVSELGFRLELIAPADDPSMAVVSAAGTRLRLQRDGGGDPGTIHVRVAGGTGREVVAPNGTRIVFASERADLPPWSPSFTMSPAAAERSWVTGRAGMRYRDLIPGRQGGRFIASHIVIPTAGPVPDYVHYHRVRFQMIYCYRGWVRVVYEDQGEPFVMAAGDCVLQPPEIRHRVLESSDDLHVIEVTSPAEHDTLVEHAVVLPNAPVERDYGGQRFSRHRAAGAPWQPSGVNGFERRDLGIAAATRGLADGAVIRHAAATPVTLGAHDAEIRFLFVLAGTAALHVAGDEPSTVAGGDAVTVPPGLLHGFGACSGDFEYLDVRVGSASRPEGGGADVAR